MGIQVGYEVRHGCGTTKSFVKIKLNASLNISAQNVRWFTTHISMRSKIDVFNFHRSERYYERKMKVHLLAWMP